MSWRLWFLQGAPLARVTGQARQDDGIEPLAIRFPIPAEHALLAEAGAQRKASRRDIAGADEHLEAAEPEGVERPRGQQAERFGRHAAPPRCRRHSTAELTDPMLPEHGNNLAQVGVVRPV